MLKETVKNFTTGKNKKNNFLHNILNGEGGRVLVKTKFIEIFPNPKYMWRPEMFEEARSPFLYSAKYLQISSIC